jgi:hypothetical protein
MRRIATLVATGAVAAAAVISLVASPASADTAGVVVGGSARAVSSSDVSALASHSWRSYNGFTSVYAHGTYSRTSKTSKVYGYVTDSGSSSSAYHATVYMRWTEKGKSGYDWIAVANPYHHKTVKFPNSYYSHLTTHLYVAEGFSKYVKGKGWVLVKAGHLHKIY